MLPIRTCFAGLTLMSGAELFMREDVGLTDAEVEVLAGSMNVFMLASILPAGWVADHLGRRRTLVLANALLEPVVTTEFTILELTYSRPGSLPRACAPTGPRSTGADNI